MVLVAHLLIALTSLIYSGYVFLRPSPSGIKLSSGLAIATIASGTYLVVSTHSPMLKSCLVGLAYLGVVSVGIVLASIRLSRQKIKSNGF